MTASKGEDERRLLPRWRNWRSAVELGELKPHRPSQPMPDQYLQSFRLAEHQWIQRGDLQSAIGTVATSLHSPESLERETVLRAVDAIESGSTANSLAGDLVYEWRRVVSNEGIESAPPPTAVSLTRETLGGHVRALRARLREYPRNPLTRIDLARAYFAIDEHYKAEREVRTALAMDSDNRFIVRSAARFYVDVQEESAAAEIVSDASGFREDPWLMSVAVELRSSGRGFRNRDALQMVDDRNLRPWHVSELSASLASREILHGSARKGRQLMRVALLDPTENSAAHGEWARANGYLTGEAEVLPRGSFEALGRRHADKHEWRESVEAAWGWITDEPFSIAAAGYGSLWAIEASEFGVAVQMVDVGLIANPADCTLLNNRAFANACRWDLNAAVADIIAVDRDSADREELTCLVATAGLVAYRAGDPNQGRSFYEQSIASFLRQKLVSHAARAAVNLAGEELRTDSPEAGIAVSRATDLVRRSVSRHVEQTWNDVLKRRGLGVLEPDSPAMGAVDLAGIRKLPQIVDPD